MAKKIKRKPQRAKPKTKKSGSARKRTRISSILERPVSTDLRAGTIMSIDPGTQRLGWCISRINFTNGGTEDSERIAFGTVYGKGASCESIAEIASEVRDIQEKFGVTHVFIEDYQLISGKTDGLFAVPSLISVMKYDWYIRKDSVPTMVKAATWKHIVCGNGSAGKDMVVTSLIDKNLIDKTEYDDIMATFKARNRKADRDPQDCFDAIAIDSFVKLSIQDYIKQERLKPDDGN